MSNPAVRSADPKRPSARASPRPGRNGQPRDEQAPRHRASALDRALLAAKIAAVRDATERVRAVLPGSAEAFASDRTAGEVVT